MPSAMMSVAASRAYVTIGCWAVPFLVNNDILNSFVHNFKGGLFALHQKKYVYTHAGATDTHFKIWGITYFSCLTDMRGGEEINIYAFN